MNCANEYVIRTSFPGGDEFVRSYVCTLALGHLGYHEHRTIHGRVEAQWINVAVR